MAPTPPTSPFAALLRRSRFAQYDPHIGQVYVSYGGDAARGHWGLKRPIPLRKRHAHITVKSVDSPEQQTEWKHAEQQARWIKMYDEAGVPPSTPSETSWYHKLGPDTRSQWSIDSEFATKDTNTPPVGSNVNQLPSGLDPERAKVAVEQNLFVDGVAAPNINAMTEKEFEVYLRKLRKLRPQFRQFVEARLLAETEKDQEPTPVPSFWELTNKRNQDLDKKFLSHLQYKKYTTEGSRVIEQRPHKFAGLTYTHHSALQSRFYNSPKPGRMLIKASSTERNSNSEDMKVSFAGTSASLPSALRDSKGLLSWHQLVTNGETNPEDDGVTRMQFTSVELLDAPEVVGDVPQNLARTNIHAHVRVVTEQNGLHRANPHRPGSREYVAHVDTGSKQSKPSSLFNPKKVAVEAPELKGSVVKANLLVTLSDLVRPAQET